VKFFFREIILFILNSKHKKEKEAFNSNYGLDISLDLNPFRRKDLSNKHTDGVIQPNFLGMKIVVLIDSQTLTPVFFHIYPANIHESRIYPVILEMLKRGKLIRFGDAVIMDRGFYGYRNYLIGLRYGIIPLIIPRKNFREEKLKGLVGYPLSILSTVEDVIKLGEAFSMRDLHRYSVESVRKKFALCPVGGDDG